MFPHPTTITAVEELERRQLLAWVARDRRATSGLGNDARHARTHRRRLAVNVLSTRIGSARAAWSNVAARRGPARSRAANRSASAILAQFFSKGLASRRL